MGFTACAKKKADMQLKFALLADAVNESRDGKLNITGEFNAIIAEQVPLQWPVMVLVARIEAGLAEGTAHRFHVDLVDENGQQLLEDLPTVDARFVGGGEGLPLRANFIVSLVGLQFQSYGTYQIRVFVDDEFVGDTMLHVVERLPVKP